MSVKDEKYEAAKSSLVEAEVEREQDDVITQESETSVEADAEADDFQSTQSERDAESGSLSYWAFNPGRNNAASPAFSGASSFANDSQHSESSMSVFDLNILVCGKSGNGKSTISNFLVGYERFLTGFLGTNLNEPLHCEVGEAKVCNLNISMPKGGGQPYFLSQNFFQNVKHAHLKL